MKFRVFKTIIYKSITALFLTVITGSGLAHASFQKQPSGRFIQLTLLPDYESERIGFDGKIDIGSESDILDLAGLGLQVEHQWKNTNDFTWNFLGTFSEGDIRFDETQGVYHLTIEPIVLRPQDELEFFFPFVSIDVSQIEPVPDSLYQEDEFSFLPNHRFSYSGGEDGKEIRLIDIPFQPVEKNIDLMLIPLMGEAISGRSNAFRLSGKIQFSSLTDFDEFGEYCRGPANSLRHADYRVAHLLNVLDFPHYSGFSGLNPAYQFKPTRIALRSELNLCQYDPAEKTGRVEATFSGRVFGFRQSDTYFPSELHGSDLPDGNFPYIPTSPFKGVNGYFIQLSEIVLGPGDTLTIRIPGTQPQLEDLKPAPDRLISSGSNQDDKQTQIVYQGPARFDLNLPYVPQAQLYVSQFPSVIRPGISFIEARFGNLFPVQRSYLTWPLLIAGLILWTVFAFFKKTRWFAVLGWIFIALALFYGVRGTYGLLCIGVLLYFYRVLVLGIKTKSRSEVVWGFANGLAGFVLICFAIYLERKATPLFAGLSEPDLSPMTPLMLLFLVGATYLLFYGKLKDFTQFTSSDFPILALFLVVLSLFDTFNNSLLALIVLIAGGMVFTNRAFQNSREGDADENRDDFGRTLQSRMSLAFGNKIVPTSFVVLILFAIGNDLSSTYANGIQISISPLIAPLAMFSLVFISVALAFTSIALLFILVYPLLPSNTGYIKATVFALFLFLVFLFGIGTDDRLIATLPNILVGRVIYYVSVPMLIGVYLDINEYLKNENERRKSEDKSEKGIDFRTASSMYFKNLQGIIGTLTGILSLVAPSVYAFVSSQPVVVTYFSLLEKLVLLPI